MDWEVVSTVAAAVGTVAAAVVAVIAFSHSLRQARRVDCERDLAVKAAREAERTKFLLGEKETVAFEAGRIADGPRTAVPTETIQALVLAALFENSDRARLQVYRALDSLPDDQRDLVILTLEQDLTAAKTYRKGLDLGSFSRRLGQLHAALRWTIPDDSMSAELKQEILRARSGAVRT
jgi:hypothetical protein